MADAAVTFLLENVAQLVRHRFNLIAGAEGELELLKKDLESLKAFLRHAARMPDKPEGFRDIEGRIRDVVYEAEDNIDSCTSHATAAINKNAIRRRLSSKRVNLAEQVKLLRQGKVIQMVATAQSFAATAMGKEPQATKHGSPSKPAKLQIIREENVVGFDDKEGKIISYLLEPKQELDVISITGMPGLGKTTLAWKVFKNEHIIKREFPNRIWIYVTQTPNIRDVFLNILKEFTSEDMSGLSDRALIETVQQYLKERKFLLVLDDVWTTEAWDAIRAVLSKSNNMSKVLLTSREKGVGAKACQPRQPYELPFLNDDQSWELLQYEVYGKLNECPDDLRVVGECIAHKCDGLPLSIVVIGGILLDQCTKDEEISKIREAWSNVSNDVSAFLKRDLKKVSDIVELSYNRLPDDLRDCFLYLAVFPEDYEISAWTLTRLWIAEGFIQGQNLEETAEENLKDLINRNLVMVSKRNARGEVKTCRIHDVIHAFCGSKASLKQQNLFQEMKFSNGAFDPPTSEINQYRRLCIHSDLENFLAQADREKATRIRSLLCFNKAPSKLPSKYAPTMVDGFDLLRVMESKSIKLDQIPRGVTKLFHLRYITLSVDTLETLAEAFSNLWNLQTLVIHTRSESLKIKANIWLMIQLRHLKTKTVITQFAQGGGEGCKNLQTLSRISPENCTKDVFTRAPHLRDWAFKEN
ncbi:putative late blight resistance protein homolog R1A-10 [Salvia miltiorrhiza]|uniref:putative late blight resistance protein homolog R1A-10 n=1 Tax=Salvia miltiorrhiza TaxID=226208 RepID=UPI0025AD2B84|nr:putative late blight resistance protein homolog R1A-10 [Salvia miltiorrhiza]